MEGKENIPVSRLRDSIEVLQKEKSKLEAYYNELRAMRKLMEEKIDEENSNIAKLTDEISKSEASSAVFNFKTEKVEKDQLKGKNKIPRENIAILCSKKDGCRDRSLFDIESFEAEARNLCETFGSASTNYSENAVKQEIESMYKNIEDMKKEYEVAESTLNKCKKELDEIALYQIPNYPREMEIPLGQRKAVLNMVECANVKAVSRYKTMKNTQFITEAELQKLSAEMLI